MVPLQVLLIVKEVCRNPERRPPVHVLKARGRRVCTGAHFRKRDCRLGLKHAGAGLTRKDDADEERSKSVPDPTWRRGILSVSGADPASFGRRNRREIQG